MLNDFNIDEWNGKKIILYGSGRDGKIIADGLRKKNIHDFIFCDKVRKTEETIQPQECIEFRDCNFIISSGKYCTEIYENLKSMGIKNENIFSGIDLYRRGRGFCKEIDFRKITSCMDYIGDIVWLRCHIMNGWKLFHLDITVTTSCTLKCKFCGSLMPYYSCKKDISDETTLRSIDYILQSGAYIKELVLIGGEPLLNQNLMIKILEKYSENPQIGNFQVITNGTIMPSTELCETMAETGKCYVIFSNYGALSKNQDEAVRLLHRYNIEATVIGDDYITLENGIQWIDYGEVKHYDFPNAKHQAMFDKCMDAERCTVLINDKVYLCPRIAHGVNAGLIPSNLSNLCLDFSDDAVKNKEIESFRDECRSFFIKRKYPPACEYCNRDAGILVERALQIK